jgi:serine/threonine-protein kinase HipA
MDSAARTRYRVTDQLFLWLLTDPGQPVLIGELDMVRSSRGVSLRYAPSWLERGFALSEDLPLVAEDFLPKEKDTAAGAVDDARPDRWGERVIESRADAGAVSPDGVQHPARQHGRPREEPRGAGR